MDYQAFLQPRDPVVLPYFGGTRVDAADRRYHVELGLAHGWWRFRVDGRRAVPLEPAEPVALDALPALRGHYVLGWVIADGRRLGRLALAPDDEPAPLARVTARRWHSGDLVLDTVDLEDDAELEARARLEQRQPLAGVRGVVPSLRAAFGYALGAAVARALGLRLSLRELAPRVADIAETGDAAVRALHDRLAVDRAVAAAARQAWLAEAQAEAELASGARARQRAVHSAQRVPRTGSPYDRADRVLDAAGARLLGCRRLRSGAELDVTYDVDGERIISTVAADTLEVLDPGICLIGARGLLTLDAMPSVVREAIAEDHLNLTRHP